MLNFINLSKFYDCAAMIRSRANGCFFFFFFFFFFQPKLVPNLVCAKTSFSEIWGLSDDCVSYVFRRYHIDIYEEASRLVVYLALNWSHV